MFDLNALFPADTAMRPAAVVPAANSGYRGPERRAMPSPGSRWLALMLDEIDYGMVLLDEDDRVLHVNHAARAELAGEHPLQLLGGALHTRAPQDLTALLDALQAARRGLRRLVRLGSRQDGHAVAVVPLSARGSGAPQATLLLLGKRRVCERLSVQCFARLHALTPAETRVLEALCQGLEPRAVAEEHGVGLATVRTQIGSIRSKTGAESIRDLARRVAVLPPMVSSLRAVA